MTEPAEAWTVKFYGYRNDALENIDLKMGKRLLREFKKACTFRALTPEQVLTGLVVVFIDDAREAQGLKMIRQA